MTYRELDERVDALATGLDRAGVEAGNRIVILGDITGVVPQIIHAAWRCGATAVPIDPQLSASRRRRRIDLIDPALVVGPKPLVASTGIDAVPIVDLIASPRADLYPAVGPDDPAVILFTSGTTGAAKAVVLTARNLHVNAYASGFRLGIDPTDRWITCLEPHHMGGFAPIVRSAVYGTTLQLTPFGPNQIEMAIHEREGTVISLVPTMLQRLLAADIPLAACRAVLVGGAATPPGLVAEALDRDVAIFTSYGMTETASQIATATPDELRCDPTTVGKPLRWTDVSIDGNAPGPVRVEGPTVATGYVTSDGLEPFDGTITTGDCGSIGVDGRVTVVGRHDDRIVSGGVTVDPRAIESTIRTTRGIEDVAVIGIEDPEWGERPVGVMRVADDRYDASELEARIERELRPAERPITLLVVDAIPRTHSGTVNRSAIRRLVDRRLD